MSFLDTVAKAKTYLREHSRVSLRALKLEFALDDEPLEALIAELVDIQQVAAREGKTLYWIAPAESPAEPDRAPRGYTPKYLADKILRSKFVLEGECKQVTVMFADVKGSMELAERLGSEEWHKLLDRFFQILTDGVHRFEGTVNQYTGDGIMALFGAPIAHEDHAQRACYAALHLRDALRLYAQELEQRGLVFSTRIGLNSGEVVVGKIGDDLRMDYTAQGHCVGLAQRMEQLAEPGVPCLAAPTAALVEGQFELEDRGELVIKGGDCVRAFGLMGLGAQPHPLDRARVRGLSRFVGRDDELAALDAALARADTGQSQIVGIVADAGVGKSRLIHEFTQRAGRAGAHVAVGHCASHGRSVPLLGYLDLLRNRFQITDRDDAPTAREKIRGLFATTYPDLGEYVPLLCDFLGAPDPEHPVETMEPEERQRRLLEWQHRTLEQRDSRECTVVVMEDMHWVDPATEALLASLAATPARGTRQLVLLIYRPEYQPEWARRTAFRQLQLSQLTAASVSQLLADLLGPELAASELATRIRDRCAGTPFFLEELIRSLAESGTLAGERGAYRLAAPVEGIRLPVSVKTVLAARIDRLAEREKQILCTASVIGRTFPRDLLAAEGPGSERDVDEALRVLCDAELLTEEALYPELEYAFKHPLTQEVAYDSQLSDWRRQAHRRVAAQLEARYADRLGEKAALIAQHLEQGGDDPAAAGWHAKAAEWAGISDVRAALDHWRRARELVGPEQAVLGATAASQILALGWRLGSSEQECERVFEEGRSLAERAGDFHSLASLTANYGGFRGITLGITHDYIRYNRDAVRLADETGDLALRCGTRTYLIYAYRHAGLVELGIAACDELEELLHGDPHLGADVAGISPLVGVGHVRSALQVYRGDPLDFRAVFDAHRRLALDAGYPEMVVWMRWDQAQMAAALRDEDGVASWAREARALAEERGNVADQMAKVALAIALGFEGDAQAKLQTADDVVQTIRETRRLRWIEAEALMLVAEARLALGQVRAARDAAAEATGLMTERGTYGWSLSAFASLAAAQLALGEPAAEVERTLDAYAAAIQHTGMRVFERELVELRAGLGEPCT